MFYYSYEIGNLDIKTGYNNKLYYDIILSKDICRWLFGTPREALIFQLAYAVFFDLLKVFSLQTGGRRERGCLLSCCYILCAAMYYKFTVDWRIYRSMANTHRGLVYCTIKNNRCDF